MLPSMRQSRQQIEEILKERISTGEYPSGSRLPTHRQLQEELGVSSVTLQRAFDHLCDLGYVEAFGRRGTFVAASLPQASRIALVFANDEGRGAWNRFWSAALRVAKSWSEGPFHFQPYHISGEDPNAPGHKKLCQDVAEGALSGIVFVSVPYYLGQSPVLTANIPRVCIGSGIADMKANSASVVVLSDGDLIERIIERFHAMGRRRIAVIAENRGVEFLRQKYLPCIRALGLSTRIEWWLGMPVSTDTVRCARTVTHLLCSGDERNRPDCLLVGDDNLVPHVTSGILDAGLSAPDQIEIVAHANFPYPTAAVVSCLRYGPHLEDILRSTALEIQRLAHGGSPQVLEVLTKLQDSNLAT
jgi:DNA-binding LacI/PurR family transcriptional regulator